MKNPFRGGKGQEPPKEDKKEKWVYIPGQTLKPVKRNEEGERRYEEMKRRAQSEEARKRREREDRDRHRGRWGR